MIFKLFGIEKNWKVIESLKYSDWGTVFDNNTRTGLANFYGLILVQFFSFFHAHDFKRVAIINTSLLTLT